MAKFSMWERLQNGEKLIMGILNATPDSFFKGSRIDESSVLEKAEHMLKEGADLLDVGGYSTRPGAKEVGEQEEIDRVCSVIQKIKTQSGNVELSIDTFRSGVAEAAIKEGASVINDISGGLMDQEILAVAVRYDVPYVLMHMRGTPATMQDHCAYENVASEVKTELIGSIEKARSRGVTKVILDPGFGFSKTLDQNYQLLKELKILKELGLPLLVGVSRKSMIYKFLECEPEEALNATSVLNTFALLNGADILRVHDVKQAVEARDLIIKTLG